MLLRARPAAGRRQPPCVFRHVFEAHPSFPVRAFAERDTTRLLLKSGASQALSPRLTCRSSPARAAAPPRHLRLRAASSGGAHGSNQLAARAHDAVEAAAVARLRICGDDKRACPRQLSIVASWLPRALCHGRGCTPSMGALCWRPERDWFHQFRLLAARVAWLRRRVAGHDDVATANVVYAQTVGRN